MIVRQGLIVKFSDRIENTVVIRTSDIAAIYQDKAAEIHIILHSGLKHIIRPSEYITFDDVITKIFF